MSNAKNDAIKNAQAIIERFGGIRPMASKINVAVTTIQGWKKRDVIPAKRRNEIIQAAENHNIDIDDILNKASPANKNETKKSNLPSTKSENTIDDTTKNTPNTIEAAIQAAIESDTITQNQNLKEETTPLPPLKQNVTKKVRNNTPKTSWITTAMLLTTLMAVILILWPQKKDIEKTKIRLNAIEKQVNAVNNDMKEIKNNGSFFGNLIPKDLEERITTIEKQLGAAQAQINQALTKAKAISNDILAKNAGTVAQRINKLEQHATTFAMASPELNQMIERLKTFNTTLSGQMQLDQAVTELNTLLKNLDSTLATQTSTKELYDLLHDKAMITGQTQTPILNQTFEGVPPENIKAAAILLGFSQFRNALNRDNKDFENDLILLSTLVGSDNTDLQTAITQLAPHAKKGVLSPKGLSTELQNITKELVISSLNGENISITEKAKAHFNEVLTIEKNGKLISGTDTQQKISQAQSMLENGNISGAITILETLEGQSVSTTAPFIKQARNTLLAKKVETMLQDTLKLYTLELDALNDTLDWNTITNTLTPQ